MARLLSKKGHTVNRVAFFTGKKESELKAQPSAEHVDAGIIVEVHELAIHIQLVHQINGGAHPAKGIGGGLIILERRVFYVEIRIGHAAFAVEAYGAKLQAEQAGKGDCATFNLGAVVAFQLTEVVITHFRAHQFDGAPAQKQATGGIVVIKLDVVDFFVCAGILNPCTNIEARIGQRGHSENGGARQYFC